jgi:hypothetical protein
MALVLPPKTYRTGVWQMRPALFGYQYRTKPYGQTWGLRAYRFAPAVTTRAAIQTTLGDGWVELPFN